MESMDYLYLLGQIAFLALTLWMLIDAYQRGEYFWLWIILIIPGLGAGAYFLLHKAPDYWEPLAGWLSSARKPSLDELRYQVEQAPTLARNLALAEALIERGQHTEAFPYLEAARKQEPEHGQVLYALAVCRVELGQPTEALPLLDAILARDKHWSDYRAWRLLVQAKAQAGDAAGALAACRALVKLSPTLEFQCLLAEHLLRAGQSDEAQAVLADGLNAYRYAPGGLRRRNRRWARQAKQLQKKVLTAAK